MVLKYVAWALAAIVLLALAAYFLAYQVATKRYEKQWTVHKADFPIPFSLRDDELAALRADRIAAGAYLQRACGGKRKPLRVSCRFATS